MLIVVREANLKWSLHLKRKSFSLAAERLLARSLCVLFFLFAFDCLGCSVANGHSVMVLDYVQASRHRQQLGQHSLPCMLMLLLMLMLPLRQLFVLVDILVLDVS